MDLRKRAPSVITHNTFQPLKTVNIVKNSKVTFNVPGHERNDLINYKELSDLRHKKQSLEQKQFNSSPSQSSNNNLTFVTQPSGSFISKLINCDQELLD
jgi:uncharacterized protein YycO